MSRPLWTAELWAQREARTNPDAKSRVFLAPARAECQAIAGIRAVSGFLVAYSSSVYALSLRLRVG